MNEGSERAVRITKHLRPGRRGFLRKEDSRNLLRRTLEYYVRTMGLVVYAWSVTVDRFEIIVALPAPVPLGKTLAAFFHHFGRRHRMRYRNKRGPMFRNRYLTRVLESEEEIWEEVCRLHAEAASLEAAARPGSEPFSSSRAWLGVPDGVTQPRRPVRERAAA